MIRGTNEEFRFKLPYPFAELDKVDVLFWQDGYYGPSSSRPLPIRKVYGQCSQGRDPYELSVTLNQEETLRFSEKRKAKIRLRATTVTGIPIASLIKLVPVYPTGDDSILDDDILPTPDFNDWVYLDGGIVQ